MYKHNLFGIAMTAVQKDINLLRVSILNNSFYDYDGRIV